MRLTGNKQSTIEIGAKNSEQQNPKSSSKFVGSFAWVGQANYG